MSNEVLNPDQQFLDANGDPLGAGTLTFYVNLASTTLSTIYSDEALSVPQNNPYTLDASGRTLADIKYLGKKRMVVKDVSGATIRTIDNVATAINSTMVFTTNVDLYADLASQPAEIGQKISISGHTTAGLGGGDFLAVSSAGLTTDGGTISASATAGVYWKRQVPYDIYDAWMFGATGVEAADEAAIALAITAIKANNRGTLIIPSKISATATVPAPALGNSESIIIIDYRGDRTGGIQAFGVEEHWIEGKDSCVINLTLQFKAFICYINLLLSIVPLRICILFFNIKLSLIFCTNTITVNLFKLLVMRNI